MGLNARTTKEDSALCYIRERGTSGEKLGWYHVVVFLKYMYNAKQIYLQAQ